MSRARIRLGSLALPFWKRPAFWQTALGGAALGPFAFAAWMSLAPLPRSADPAPAPSASRPELRIVERDAAPEGAVEAIAGANLFSYTRQDWALAAAPDEEAQDDSAALKAALETVKKLRFVGAIRVGPTWTAMFDFEGRTPEQELLVLSVGAEHESWRVESVTRQDVTLAFRDTRETLQLVPQIKPGKAKPDNKGRRIVELREPTAARHDVLFDPPLSRAEAYQRLSDALKHDDPAVKQRLEDLFKLLDDDGA